MNFFGYKRLATVRAALFDQARRPWAGAILLFAIYWIVAAASYSGSIQKHGMPDGARGGGIEVMLDASAKKPYVYRQFAPVIANFLDRSVSDSIKNLLNDTVAPEKTYVRTRSVTNPEFRFRYICIYYLCFLSLLGSLFAMRKILLNYDLGGMVSMVAPAFFVLAFPYLQTVGGYYYDQLELCFTALAFLAAMRCNLVLLFCISAVATLNKESFFFFIPALFPLLEGKMGRIRALVSCGVGLLIAGLVNVGLKLMFFDSAGVAAEFKLFRNILNYLNPLTYLQMENTFGIIGPAGAFLGTLLVILIVGLRGWQSSPREVRQHVLIAACFNLPLFFAFCATGELRNLSLSFVGFVVLSANAMKQWFHEPQGVARASTQSLSVNSDLALPLEKPDFVKDGVDSRINFRQSM